MLRIIVNRIKEFNKDCQFEELNSKKEFIKSKFQHDGNLHHIKKLYFCKSEEKKKTFFEIIQKDFRFNDSFLPNISDCLETLTNYFLKLLEENFNIVNNKENAPKYRNITINETNSHYYERFFIKKFVQGLIQEDYCENKLSSKLNSVYNDKNIKENEINQTPILIISDEFSNNENNYVYKTNLAKVNPNINLKVNNINRLNFFNNEKEENMNDSKQRSFKALKFESDVNDGIDLKEYTPMSLSANLNINDWLNNLIKNSEKKFNLKFKEDVKQYLNQEEQELFTKCHSKNSELIKNCLEKFYVSKNHPECINEIEVLSFRLIKELILRDERKYENNVLKRILIKESFLKSVLLIAAECVLLHHNISEVLFYKIASKEFLNLDLFEFWKIINPILNLVSIIDNNVNRHLSEIEIVLFTFLIWTNSEKFKDNFNKFLDEDNIQGI